MGQHKCKLVVLYVFYELFISNKFEVAVQISGIQSLVFIFSLKKCFRRLLFLLNSKIGFLFQIKETQYLFTYRSIKSAIFAEHALE